MPRRQRFKPSRKPKPAIEPSDRDAHPNGEHGSSTTAEPRDLNIGSREDTARVEVHPNDAEPPRSA